MYPVWAVVIATYNRPGLLRNLLESIQNSSVKPNQVIIVSAGDSIEKSLIEFKNIKLIHKISDVANQSYQKKLGISLLDNEIDWVLFLDDDLLLDINCIKNLFEFIDSRQNKTTQKKCVGVGLSLPIINSDFANYKYIKWFGKLFKLTSSKPGVVLTSGQAISYLGSNYPIRTNWLNGASIWRKEFAQQYGKNLMFSKYSAYEDVIFSYEMGKLGELWFNPTAKVYFQEGTVTNYLNYEVQLISLAWKYYFVIQHRELSRLFLFWSQIGRSLYYLTQLRKIESKKKIRILFLPLQILKFVVFKTNLKTYLNTVSK
jgi:glycosyltransferase involved in cell wall biosynthesis